MKLPDGFVMCDVDGCSSEATKFIKNRDYCIYHLPFTKELCYTNCNLNGKCYCQDKSQKEVDSCGMEEVLRKNKIYKRQIRNGTYVPR